MAEIKPKLVSIELWVESKGIRYRVRMERKPRGKVWRAEGIWNEHGDDVSDRSGAGALFAFARDLLVREVAAGALGGQEAAPSGVV